MGRIHLFEWEDLPWFPELLRNFGTDFLQFLANKTKLYQPLIPILKEAIEDSGSPRLIDLASGGGGGLLYLNEELRKEIPDLEMVLTDYYPNLPAFERSKALAPNFSYRKESIDARAVPTDLKGLRTQFLSLHHFKPADAQAILQNAVDDRAPIFIVEAQERSLPSILAMLFSPITVLFTTPLIRPFKWSRLLFTYLIPVVPLFVLWDGVVSSLRTYSVKEMQGLVDNLKDADRFNWEIKRLRSGPGVLLYLRAWPKN